MVDKINYRSLVELLLRHQYFIVSYQGFKERVLSDRLKIAKDFFLHNEDYHLLSAMQIQEEFFKNKVIFVNVFEKKRLIIAKADFYSKFEYKDYLSSLGIKVPKEELTELIKIANGY